jgi:tetratricopeptide (TPR) repeat protein
VPTGPVADAIEQHGEPAVRGALTYLQQRLGEETISLVAEPHRRLARALGRGLREQARSKQLVLIQDTYEIVDAVDPSLREAILASGPRVLWVIAGRSDLASSNAAEQRVGYRVIADRIRLRPLAELGEFSLGDVESYLGEAVPERTLPPGGAQRIHRATEGVPLAVKLAAQIWRKTASLEAIEEGARPQRDRNEMVRELTDRFLVHCTDEEERSRIFALALLRRPDPDVWGAMVAPGAEANRTLELLDNLARSHSFIFTRENWLHDKVRRFLREGLADPRYSGIRDTLSERAWRWCGEELEQRGEGRTWEERLDSEAWVEQALDYLHYRFWCDMEAAWDALPAFFLAGLAYDLSFARSIVEAAADLEDGDSRRRRIQIEALRTLTITPWYSDQDQQAIRSLRTVWRRNTTHHHDDVELDAILRWAEAKALLDHDDDHAQQAGKQFAALVPQLDEDWERLREQVGNGLHDAGRKVLWPHGRRASVRSPNALPFFKAAEQCRAWTDSAFWTHYSAALNAAGHYDEAVGAAQKAVQLDPKSANVYDTMGIALSHQGEIEEAVDAFEQAIAIDPHFASAYHGLGMMLGDQGKPEDAVDAFRQAIAIDSQYAPAYCELGYRLAAQDELEKATDAFRQAIAADPEDGTAYRGLGNALLMQDKPKEALDEFQQAVPIHPDPSIAWLSVACAARRLGDDSTREMAIKRARSSLHVGEVENLADAYHAACIESVAGDVEKALSLLEEAMQKGYMDTEWIKRDPDLYWICGDPRFRTIIENPPGSSGDS